MAEMRFRAYPLLLLAAVVLLALPAVAAAGPHPIKKPVDVPAKTNTPPAKTPAKAPAKAPAKTPSSSSSSSSSNSNQSPIKKPTTQTGTSGTSGSTGNGKSSNGKTAPPRIVVVNVVGRDQRSAEPTPRPVVPKVPVPDPTPLAVVSAGDRVQVHTAPTPAWKLALLALLAAAEAFLVVRLVRHRPGTLSPAA